MTLWPTLTVHVPDPDVTHDCARDDHEWAEDERWQWCVHCGLTGRR
jgi:hypothetical protein